MAQQTEAIGRRLAKYRKLEGWSAQKLADESGLTRSVITNLENGRRDDMTVTEMLAVCSALRIPPAALLFPVESPLAAEPVEGAEATLSPRVIDLIDWLSGSDSDFGDDQELADFMQGLEELDSVVLYPIGLTVLSTYGKAGRAARALIRSARSLAKAQDRADRLRREVLVFSRLLPTELPESFLDLLESGPVSGSSAAADIIAALDPADQSVAERLFRAFDAAVTNLRDAQAQFRLLGGDPRPGGFMQGPSPRDIMHLVQGGPHEARSETIARGGLAEGVVSSPLRLYTEDAIENIRDRWRQGRSEIGGTRTGESPAPPRSGSLRHHLGDGDGERQAKA